MAIFTSNIPMIINNTSAMIDVSAQNMDLSGNLFVSGSSTLSESLDVSGDVVVDGSLDVSGEAFFGSDLDVSGDVVVDGSLDVSGEVRFGDRLDVSGDVVVDGNVGVGGGHSSEKLKVYGDVNITGNINVDGSFSFSEVVQNTTTVNNTLLVSTQLDVSNEGTGPALKVSQLGDGDDQDVALFNAGDEGDALKIDSSGNTFVYKDIDISGHTTLKDVSCNGNIDICGGSLTIVSNTSDDPIMTITNNNINQPINESINSLSPSIWAVAGESVDRITSATISITSGLATLDYFDGRQVWSIADGVTIGQDPPVIINAIIPQASTTYTISIAYAEFPSDLTSLFLQQPINRSSTNASKNVFYNNSLNVILLDEFPPLGGGHSFSVSGLDIDNKTLTVKREGNTLKLFIDGILVSTGSQSEVYNGANVDRIVLGGRPSNSNTSVASMISGVAVWDRSLSDSEIELLTYDNISSYPIRTGLKIENAGLEVDGGNVDISGGKLSVVGDETNGPIMTIRNDTNTQEFDTIVIRRIEDGDNRWIGIPEIQLWKDNDNVMPDLVTPSTFNVDGTPLQDIPDIPFFIDWSDKTLDEVETTNTLYVSNVANEIITETGAYWGIKDNPRRGVFDYNVAVYIPLTSSLNTNDIQSLVIYVRFTEVTMFVGARVELYNRAIDPTLSSPVAYTNTISTQANKYRFDFPAIDTYNSFVNDDFSTTNIISTATNSTDITFNDVIDTRRTGLKIENAGLEVDGDTIMNGELEVDGQGIFNNNVQCVSLTQTSDDRLKKDEQYISNATQTITKLRPQTYKKYQYMNYSGDYIVESGLIAQEIYYDVHELRHLVSVPDDADISGHILTSEDPSIDPDYSNWGSTPAGVNYNGFVAYLIKAIQEQQEIINEEKEKNQTQYNELLARIQALES